VQRTQGPVTLTVELARIDSKTVSYTAPAPASRPKVTPAKDPIAAKCWEVLGLKLERASRSQLESFRSRYGGGMRVLDVRPKSPAADYGVKKGDILVGLHVWETVRFEDINYILNQTSLISGPEPLKFYVVRGQEVLYGNLRFAQRQK